MASRSLFSFQVPQREQPLERSGLFSRSWVVFFNLVKTLLEPLGREEIFEIVNGQATAADVQGLYFDATQVSQGIVDYLIQRVTTGSGEVELITSGTFHVVYKPKSATWALVTMGTPGPSAPQVTISITSGGQVQYTSVAVGGTASISRIVYRARTLKAKNHQYSTNGIL